MPQSKRLVGAVKSKGQASGKFSPARFQSRSEKQEFGSGKKEYQICKDCQSAYYDKSWHHDLSGDKHLADKNLDKKQLKFIVCPACMMIKNKQFEGSITIYNTPELIKGELINLVTRMGETARSIDPMDRVSKIKDSKNILEIWTTENQLARKISRKIKSTFPKQLGKEKIDLPSGSSDVIRIFIGSLDNGK